MRAIQRSRLVSAMYQVCAERGAANVTVAHIVAAAGISRRTFYEIFVDCEECQLAALDEAVSRGRRWVTPAFRAPGPWRDRVRAALDALLRFLDSDPHVARFLIVETLAAGPEAMERRLEVVARMAAALDEDGAQVGPGSFRCAITAEATVGALLAVIHAHMLKTARSAHVSNGVPGGRLIELLNPLMSIVVLPYLGHAVAWAELQEPSPAVPQPRMPDSRPPSRLGLRLTFRTIQVMTAVAELPGASNRRIGDAAGVADQGQISKLLARLKRAGVIEDMSTGAKQGAPKAWALTDEGRELLAGMEVTPVGTAVQSH